MPELISSAADLVGDAVDALHGVLSGPEEFGPVDRPCLPAQDPEPGQRTLWLDSARRRWDWQYDYIPGMSVLRIPGTEDYKGGHPTAYKSLLPREAHPPNAYLLERAASLVPLAAATVRERFSEGLTADKGTVSDVADYNALIRKPLKVPETCRRWQEDAVFAWQRVAGLNPLIIQGVTELPAWLGVDDTRLQGVWRAGLDLETELRDGNVFLADYTCMSEVSDAQRATDERYVWPAVGVFHVDRKASPDAPLMPLAIRLGAPEDTQHLYTPQDGVRWSIAKTALQCADVTLHEMGTHLGRAHFGLEGVVVACHRTLSRRHPVMVLLQPHFRIVVFNNFEGRELLVNEGGKVDSLMAGRLKAELGLVREVVAHDGDDDSAGIPQTRPLSLVDFSLPADLDARRAKGIPSYPYAEDGLEVWNAISAFCTEYLTLYYGSDALVASDVEVQSLVRELASPEGAHLDDVPSVQTVAALADLLTRFIYASGPLHSAINFAQYECAASAANMPLALYRPLPSALPEDDDEALAFWLEVLPPIEQAASQLRTIVELTSYHFDQLGQYHRNDFKDPAVKSIIERFQSRLAAIDHLIDARNTERLLAYTFLQPKNILNSTSI